MRWWKWILKCPVLFLLLAGWGGLAVFTCSEGKMAEALDHDILHTPAFTALLEADAQLPESVPDDLEEVPLAFGDNVPDALSEKKDSGKKDSEKKDSEKKDSKKKDSGKKDKAPETQGKKVDAGSQTAKPQEQPAAGDSETKAGAVRYEKYKKTETNSQYYSDPGRKALTMDYKYEKVDRSYFDDAVFIGDSRTLGMQNYSGLDNADFFAKTGLNVYQLLDDQFITEPSTGSLVSVTHMLKNYKYGKIYFMIGINELGTGSTEIFQKAYERVLRKFRKWQPDAVIYIQGIIPVSRAKADSDEIFNNVNINDKNVAISQLADGEKIFYLDVSAELVDESGYLRPDYTFDDVHMYAQYYELWTDYLLTHAVVLD